MKPIKCFAIEDRSLVGRLPVCNRRGFDNLVFGYAKTTDAAIAKILDTLTVKEFDSKILEEPLAAIPKQEVDENSFHFIVVRWS